MPRVSAFYGIAVYLYYRDHAPPHFHAIYGEHEALIEIATATTLTGKLPRRARLLVEEWAVLHRDELQAGGLGLGRRRSVVAPDPAARLIEGRPMILRIESAVVAGPHLLDLAFTDGTRKRVDVRPLFGGPVFEPLADPDYFARAELDPVCGTVVWPNGADFAPEALHALPPVAGPQPELSAVAR